MALDLCWEDAPEVEQIAVKLIESAVHDRLAEARILYCFRSKAAKSQGNIKLATISTVTGKIQHLLKADYILEVAQDQWYSLGQEQRLALIDHELTHCVPDLETGGWALRGHDIEEFYEIVERHGHWLPDMDEWTDALERYIVKRTGENVR